MPYRYRWAGDHTVIIDGHTTPRGTGVEAIPGQEFETVEAVDTEQVPFAVLLDGSRPKRARRKKAASKDDGADSAPDSGSAANSVGESTEGADPEMPSDQGEPASEETPHAD